MQQEQMKEEQLEQPIVEEEVRQPIGENEVRKAMETLHKYKQGKSNLENKIVKNEKWWKMRHWDFINKAEGDPRPASAWLFNCIISKHADYMDAYPTPNILPREEGDTMEAKKLSSIVPVVLKQNDCEQVYSDEAWYKLKNGTGVYGVFWDANKLNGLGDISIKSMDILSLYWEPGVKDIQKSRNFFSVELVDNELLEDLYPETRGNLSKANDITLKEYLYDDSVDTTGKSLVVDWYYKKQVNGKQTLQYCKFVDDIVLYATENDAKRPTKPQAEPVYNDKGQPMLDETGTPVVNWVEVETGLSMAEKGWYEHGKYPFIFDVLFKEEGMPVGFGFVDVCKNPQMSIDLMNNAFEKNALMVSNPRYFFRQDGGINEEEFSDPFKMLIHVDGNLGDDSIKPVSTNLINSNYIGILENKIQELKETAGNRDAVTGGTTSGVTAASAIAAMQESAGKTSRDQIKTTYRAYEEMVGMVIELIRQFYDMPRQFRIMGEQGTYEYITYSNEGLQPQAQGVVFGQDLGDRLPIFDIDIQAEKENPYSQLSQNELALQFYNSGFFNPEYTDQVLACLDMMDFQGKERVIQKVQANGGMYQQMIMMQQQMLQMSEMVDNMSAQLGNPTNIAEQYASAITGEEVAQPDAQANITLPQEQGKNNIVEKSKERTQATTQPR